MLLTFYKYQGTGNDFLMIDNRQDSFRGNDAEFVSYLCNRKMGVGADGLILLENDPQTDFKMVYFNADGNEGSMCGNGGRCIVAFANRLGLIETSTRFNAVDGTHRATVTNGLIRLEMQHVEEIRMKPTSIFLNG